MIVATVRATHFHCRKAHEWLIVRGRSFLERNGLFTCDAIDNVEPLFSFDGIRDHRGLCSRLKTPGSSTQERSPPPSCKFKARPTTFTHHVAALVREGRLPTIPLHPPRRPTRRTWAPRACDCFSGVRLRVATVSAGPPKLANVLRSTRNSECPRRYTCGFRHGWCDAAKIFGRHGTNVSPASAAPSPAMNSL
jgi:hypothetical protein